MRVFIAGYPRTATSGLYKALAPYFDYRFYEPFNNHVLHDILHGGGHRHDRVGEVPHSYGRLPPQVLRLVEENSRWLHEWGVSDEPGEPYLGGRWREVLSELFSVDGSVLVKDVYAWPLLPEMSRMLRDVVFVTPLRWWEKVYESLRSWFNQRRLLLGSLRELAGRPWSILRPREFMRRRLTLHRTLSPRAMMGVGVFYRFLIGPPPRGLRGLRLLRHMVHATYSKYIELVMDAFELGNVHVLMFCDRVPDMGEVARSVLEENYVRLL